MTPAARAALCRAIHYRAHAVHITDPQTLRAWRAEVMDAPAPDFAHVASTYDVLDAYTAEDMPPLTDDLSLLVDVAAFRHGHSTRAATWRAVGVNPDQGRELLSKRSAHRVDWPLFFTLRTYALGG